MTKLEAVNAVLRRIGLTPVSALDTAGNSATSQAERFLDDADIDFQSRGWHFNSNYNITLSNYTESSIIAWGRNDYGECTVPTEVATGATEVSGGLMHTLAIKNGKVVAWGRNEEGQCNVPTNALSNATKVAAGAWHSAAIVNGEVVVWGSNTSLQGVVPDSAKSGVDSIASGGYHIVALSGGTVIAWGKNDNGESTPTPGISATKISAGQNHSAALLGDGTVVCWGSNTYNQCTVPGGLTGVTDINCGAYHTIALKSDGTVSCWGRNDALQLNVPGTVTNATDVAAGGHHTSAIVGGKVIAWGAGTTNSGTVPEYGQSIVPETAKKNVTRIESGYYHNIAVKSTTTNKIKAPDGILFKLDSTGTSSNVDIRIKNGYLYDIGNNTDVFSSSIIVNYSERVAWENLTTAFANHAISVASMNLNRAHRRDKEMENVLREEIARRWVECKREDNEMADTNFLNTDEMNQIRGRPKMTWGSI